MKINEQQIIADIQHIYELDKRPFVCGYSGGKDSSVVLDLVLKALLLSTHNIKPTYILFSDTKLEMKPFIEGVDESFKKLDLFAKKHNLNLIIRRVEPKKTDTFSCLFFGAGYVLSSTGNRWCTDRWKIKPQEREIKSLLETHGGFISITGQRRSESPDRAKRLEACTVKGEILKTHENKRCNLFTPIEYYSSDDVWAYLYGRQQEWIDSSSLGRVYSEAAGDTKNECRTLLEGSEGEESGCSKSARTGCDICPLFMKDKTLINLAQHHHYLKDVEEYRNWLIDLSDKSGWSERDVYMHGRNRKNVYNRDNHRKGMIVPGGMSLDFRRKALGKYLALDRKLFPITGERRVTDFELTYIQERWIEEGEHDLGVYKIAPGRTFDISENHKTILEAVLIYKNRFYKTSQVKNVWFEPHWSSHKDARYYAQLSIQLKKLGLNPILWAHIITNDLEPIIHQIIETLPVTTKQYYPTSQEEEYIRDEWKNDRTGMMTVLKRYEAEELKKPKGTLFGYEGDFGLQFEQIDELEKVGDITQCESISLQDQMAFFE